MNEPGGAPWSRFALAWTKALDIKSYESECLSEWGEAKYLQAIEKALQSEDLRVNQELGGP